MRDIIQQRKAEGAARREGIRAGALGVGIIVAVTIACLFLVGCAAPQSRTGWITANQTSVEVWNPDAPWWKWAWGYEWGALDAVHGHVPGTQRWGTVTVRDNVAYIESTGREYP